MDTTEAATQKPKRWPVALLVGLVNGIAAAVLCTPVADWAMQEHHVSNMEGGRAYAMICLWIPLAFIVGGIVGFVVSLQVKRGGFVGYLLKQGIAIALAVILVGLGAGISYASADHPPLVDGQNLALQIEVRVPAKGRSIEDLQKVDFEIALVVSSSDRGYSEMRWAEATQSNESITVPAWAYLNSRNAGREITAAVKNESPQVFSVMRRASPAIDETWSEWEPPRERFDGSKPAPDDQYQARYRVRFAGEYSPTPRPTISDEPSPTPEETPSPNESSSP